MWDLACWPTDIDALARPRACFCASQRRAERLRPETNHGKALHVDLVFWSAKATRKKRPCIGYERFGAARAFRSGHLRAEADKTSGGRCAAGHVELSGPLGMGVEAAGGQTIASDEAVVKEALPQRSRFSVAGADARTVTFVLELVVDIGDVLWGVGEN